MFFLRCQIIRAAYFVFCTFLISSAWAETPPSGAIASAHPAATQAGLEILEAGGNAFDAAVAVSAALAVVEPYSSGLGGGGFWLLHRASDKHEVMVDGRETAPAAAGHDLYLNADGNVVPGLSINGPLAAGIPGEPAALVHIANKYGRLPLARSLAPAIRLARQGFTVDKVYRKLTSYRLAALQDQQTCADTFLQNQKLPDLGYVIKQPELALTLEMIAGQGHAGFYQGTVAKTMVDAVRAAGGIWALNDLADYRIVERKPVTGSYRGIRVTSASPPSSGGIVLLTILNILSGYELAGMAQDQQVHVITEAMRRAYRDRAEFLGDPDFVPMPVQRLIHPWYADGLRASMRLDRATPSAVLPGYKSKPGGQDTTHLSVLDREGNRVAATLSINYIFGSGFCAAGVVLNDEMDDFAAKPGVPNVYGLVGAAANAIAPGKRPLSSMTPTFLETLDRVGILGSPGGSRIITMVLHGLLAFDEGRDPADWVARRRYHHQFLPDHIQYEPDTFPSEVMDSLRAKGHILKPMDLTWGNMQAILWDRKSNQVKAASDPRGVGEAVVR